MLLDDLVLDSNAQMTIAQVMPVFLIAGAVDLLAMPTRFPTLPRWMRITQVVNAVLLLIAVGFSEILSVIIIGSGITLRGLGALGSLMTLGGVIALTLMAIGVSVWARTREEANGRGHRALAALDRRRKMIARASRSR